MTELSAKVLARNKLGAATKQYRDPQHPAVIAAREALNNAPIEDHIRALVAARPKLTESQRERLSALILGSENNSASRADGSR